MRREEKKTEIGVSWEKKGDRENCNITPLSTSEVPTKKILEISTGFSCDV